MLSYVIFKQKSVNILLNTWQNVNKHIILVLVWPVTLHLTPFYGVNSLLRSHSPLLAFGLKLICIRFSYAL